MLGRVLTASRRRRRTITTNERIFSSSSSLVNYCSSNSRKCVHFSTTTTTTPYSYTTSRRLINQTLLSPSPPSLSIMRSQSSLWNINHSYLQQQQQQFRSYTSTPINNNSNNNKKVKKCLFIDGTPLVIKSYHGTKIKLQSQQGIPTNAVYTYMKTLIHILSKYQKDFDYIGVFFDSGKQTFRNTIEKDYKANRKQLEDDLRVQIPIAKQATQVILGPRVPIIEKVGFESDDLICTLVNHAANHQNNENQNVQVYIYGSDKDLMQLVSENVKMIDPKSNMEIGPDEVMEKFGVPPEKMTFYQSLVGDAVDNIKGIPGIGPKKAAKLASQFNSVDDLIANIDKITDKSVRKKIQENQQELMKSNMLVVLDANVPLPDSITSLEDLKSQNINFDFKSNTELMQFLEQYSFNSIIKQLTTTSTSSSKSKKSISDKNSLLSSSSSSNTLGSSNTSNTSTDQDYTTTTTNKTLKVDPLELFDENCSIGKSLREAEYQLIDSDDKLDEWIEKIKQHGLVSFSTQLSITKIHENNLVGISFCMNAKQACYIPLLHASNQDTGGAGDLDFKTSQDILSMHPWFKKLREHVFQNDQVKKIGHNVKEHIKRLYAYGCDVINFDDIMVMSYVLNCGKHDHDFDTLIDAVLLTPSANNNAPLASSSLAFDKQQQHLLEAKEILIAEKEVLGIGKKKVTFARAPLILVTHYVCQHADYTARIYEKLRAKLDASKRLDKFYLDIEKPLVKTLAAIELQGVCVDQPGLEKMQQEYADKIFETANLIRKEAGYPEISREELQIGSGDDDGGAEQNTTTTTLTTGDASEEFNVNSNRQLGFAIFDKMRIGREYAKKSPKSGDYVMNSETLQKLASKGYTIAEHILQYRAMTKLYSTYIQGLQQHINPYTGRIHTTFQNALTVTGRLSSVAPNLQNIPIRTSEGKMIRRSFIAPPGHVIMKVDYSQVELRILAHIASIDVLRDAFKNGKDVHAITASQVFKVPVDGMDKSLRNKAKAINFGIIYGMSEFGLAKRIGVEVPEAKKFIEQYFQQYPGIQRYMENTKAFCRKHGYVNTLFGRKCWIPDINSDNASKRGFAERTCINTPIQGTSADITKIAMNRLHAKFQELKLKTKMIIQVHDEIVFEAPLDEVEMVTPVIKELMEGAAKEVGFSVPLTVDVDISQRWLNDQGE